MSQLAQQSYPIDDRTPGGDDRETTERTWTDLIQGTTESWVVLERIRGTRLSTADVLSEHRYYTDAVDMVTEYREGLDAEVREWTTIELGGLCATCGELWILDDPTNGAVCPECENLLWEDRLQRKLSEFAAVGKDTLAFETYWGVASGAQRKAARVLSNGFDHYEKTRLNLMVNYATRNNQLLTPKGLDLLHGADSMFIDSGGYSFFDSKGEYTTSDEEYLRYVARVQPDFFALRDYPCEPDILDNREMTVRDHQRLTTEKAMYLLDQLETFQITAEPVAVVQGWEPYDYQYHLREMHRAGVLDEVSYLGIGTLCGREDVEKIAAIVKAVRESVGQDFHLHGFGIKRPALERADVVAALDSADTLSYSLGPMYDSIASGGTISNTWKHEARGFLDYFTTVHAILRRIENGEATVSLD